MRVEDEDGWALLDAFAVAGLDVLLLVIIVEDDCSFPSV